MGLKCNTHFSELPNLPSEFFRDKNKTKQSKKK